MEDKRGGGGGDRGSKGRNRSGVTIEGMREEAPVEEDGLKRKVSWKKMRR